MIERLLFIALEQGILDVKADPRVLERYFLEQHSLAADEISAIREMFLESPPKIIHQYPRHDSEFPLWAIVLSGERESQPFLGDDGEDILDAEDEDAGAERSAAIWEHDYAILTLAQHPDVTRYYYELAKFFLIRAQDFFIENEVLDTKLSGADLVPDPRYLPAHLFVRQLTMTATREHNQIGRKPPRAFKIAGVQLNDGTSPAITGVVANITVTEGSEES